MVAFNKIYSGTTVISGESTTVGDYSAANNWQPQKLVLSGTFKWTASGSGTSEYYMELTAGGDPGISAPGKVQINSSSASATEGTAGSLAAGEWDYADNDTLGYSTVYVRLSDGTDPDTKADGYITMTQIPVAGDDVTIPAGAQKISSGLDQSGVAVNAFVVEEGYDGLIGSNTGPLKIDPDSLTFAGSGAAYLHIGSANISPNITRTGSGSGSRPFGLNLTGSNIATLTTQAGTSVAVAALANETATVATWRNIGGAIRSGSGLSLTTLDMRGGSGVLAWTSAITTITQAAANLRTEGTGTTTTHHLDSGTLTWTAGNITTLNHDSGTLDATKRTTAGTIGTLNVTPFSGQGAVQLIGSLVTITTDNKPSDPYQRTYVRI